MEKNGPAQSFRSMSSRPLKETLVLALSAFFVYTSFHALKALQSSLNQQQGLGVVSLACVYISLFVSSFLTPVIIHKGGVKPVIVAAWVCQCLYVVCNFYPHWATLIPGSVLVGFANCPWWTSLMIYLAALADVTVSMETEKKTTLQVAFSRLNGIYSAFFVASGFLGGVLSSVILFQFSDYEFSSVNVSLAENTECGAGYCFREASGQDLPRPEHAVLNVLLLCFLVMDLIGLLITVAFLPDLQRADEPCGWDGPSGRDARQLAATRGKLPVKLGLFALESGKSDAGGFRRCGCVPLNGL
nr:hypothetical protein BaRGS_014768 [Batillaria attramentaria]